MAGLYKPGDMVNFAMAFAAITDGRTGVGAATTVPQIGKVMAEEKPGKYRVTTDFGISILVDEGQLAAAQQGAAPA